MEAQRAILLLLPPLLLAGVSCDRSEPEASAAPDAGVVVTGDGSADLETRIMTFCTRCHLLPTPDVTPKMRWDTEIAKMFEFAGDDRPDLTLEETTGWFKSRAPEELPLPGSLAARGPGPLPLMRQTRYRPRQESPPTPAISYVKIVRLVDDEPPAILVCDMRHGVVMLHRYNEPGKPFQVLGRVPHPAHARVVDLDLDGVRDVLVADLGSFRPDDHDDGRIVWLRGLPDREFETFTLLTGVGRVSDIAPADLDGDGDLDLVAAVFGWRETGKVLLLENLGETDLDGKPRFEVSELDHRHGANQVAVADLDADGRDDVIILLSQEFEMVLVYFNRGGMEFEPALIHQAPHPNWGYSSMEVVDVDADGDLDVLAVNGDGFDDGLPKPYHGLSWLENTGDLPFAERRLVALPGAHRVRPADIDGDGDLDLFVVAFVPYYPVPRRQALKTDAIIWLEQVSPGVFEPWSIESVWSDHVALDAGDLDEDGDIDLVTGNYVLDTILQDPIEDWIVVYENNAQ